VDLASGRRYNMATLKKGDKSPSFRPKDQNGEKRQLVDFKGRDLLLYFYAKTMKAIEEHL
jgi:peroxiredoxin